MAFKNVLRFGGRRVINELGCSLYAEFMLSVFPCLSDNSGGPYISIQADDKRLAFDRGCGGLVTMTTGND